MTAPGWLEWTLAALMVAVALFHVGRLPVWHRQRQARRLLCDVEVSHALTGTVMALMLAGSMAPVDGARLALVFAVPTWWFLSRAVHEYLVAGPGQRAGALAGQVIASAGMVYMLVMMQRTGHVSAAGAMPMHAGAIDSVGSAAAVRGMLIAGTVATAVWATRSTRLPWPDAVTRGGAMRRSALTVGCQVAMNATTVYMLISL
jgi:hypothetical protein